MAVGSWGERDERVGGSERIEEQRADARTGGNRQFPLADRLRPLVCRRLAGYENLPEATRLSATPFRLIALERVGERGVALTSAGPANCRTLTLRVIQKKGTAQRR